MSTWTIAALVAFKLAMTLIVWLLWRRDRRRVRRVRYLAYVRERGR